MTISIWRYSHLVLAVSSFVFILLASITGAILAFEPISEQIQPYNTVDLRKVSLAESIAVFKSAYPEVIEITVDANDFVLASVISEDGDALDGYFNPVTAEFLGNKIEPSAFFQFITNLHRSLFLKSTGRFLVGFCSFLLMLISISGAILILKRQGGFSSFFSRVVNENFAQYWHVVLGRLSLLPIIIITFTGVFLSLEKFNVFTNETTSHQINFDTITASPVKKINDFPIFIAHSLSEVRSIEFPFSNDVEDYYLLKLEDEEYVINQFTGAVLSKIQNPITNVLSSLSLTLHTGKGSILWSLVLGLSAVNILFFIYSGFAMTLKRRNSKIKNKFTKDNSKYIILVGTENGSTLVFANALKEAIIASGCSVFLAELNSYTSFSSLEYLIILTSTYGEGEAPTNANKFIQRLERVNQNQQFCYAVVGFGSRSYPQYCKFAYDLDKALKDKNVNQLLEPYRINDKSFARFQEWAVLWSKASGNSINIAESSIDVRPKQLSKFKVIASTNKNSNPDSTFRLAIEPTKGFKYTSGDLLAVYPDTHKERLYSIGKINGSIHLSIKYYQLGLGSEYLSRLKAGATFNAKVIQNKNFHIPVLAKRIIMIGTGTGIMPFIGMLDQNTRTKEIYLYCGLRTNASYNLYKEDIDAALAAKKIVNCQVVLSQENNPMYVQDAIHRDGEFIYETLKLEGVIMICGSLNMYKGVMKALEQICVLNKANFQSFQSLIKSDCY